MDRLNKVNNFISGIKNGFLTFKKINNQPLFILYTILIWSCYLFMTVVCFYCFTETEDLNLAEGLFVMVAGGLGMIVPTPTGIGSYHYLVIKSLLALGISNSVAGFLAIVVHTSQAIMIIISGMFAMIILYVNQFRNNHE